MGLLKKLENMGRSLGKVVRQASPLVSFIPGIGPIASAGIGYAGSLAEGRNLKHHLKSGAMAGLSGLGIDKLQATGKLGSTLSGEFGKRSAREAALKGALGNMARNPAGIIDPMTGTSIAGEAGGGIGGFAGKALSGVSGLLKGGIGKLSTADILKLGLGGVGAYQASKAAGKANDLRERGLKYATDAYDEAAPLRKMGMEGMLDPRMADVSSLFNQPRRPYRRLTI